MDAFVPRKRVDGKRMVDARKREAAPSIDPLLAPSWVIGDAKAGAALTKALPLYRRPVIAPESENCEINRSGCRMRNVHAVA
jgi:hypothetical protein